MLSGLKYPYLRTGLLPYFGVGTPTFNGALLDSADFSEANLPGSSFVGAIFGGGTNFAGADLRILELTNIGHDQETVWPEGSHLRRRADSTLSILTNRTVGKPSSDRASTAFCGTFRGRKLGHRTKDER